MVLVDQLQEPAQQVLALRISHTIDVFDVSAHRVNGSPASDRICPHNWMDCLELGADIEGTPTRLFVQLEASSCCGVVETRLCECGSQGLEELLVGLGDAVVDLVARCPKGI